MAGAGTTGRRERLARRLDTADAVVVGLGAMLGAGVFAAFGPAARAAGAGLLVSLGIAAVVAYANATSSAQLAALYPQSGGTYVYGRERLGSFFGFLAGWGFVQERRRAAPRWRSPSAPTSSPRSNGPSRWRQSSPSSPSTTRASARRSP